MALTIRHGGDGGAAARRVVDAGAASHVYPAATAEVGSSSGIHWQYAVGRLTYDGDAPGVTPATVFDLASLTKVMVTTTVAMRLVERGVVDLDAPLARHFAGWDGAGRRTVCVRDLLEHSSGIPAWAPLFRTMSGRAAFASAITRAPLEYPPHSRSVYSDLGFILLGFLLEDRAGVSLDRQFRAIAGEPGRDAWTDMRFVPPPAWRPVTAPTRFDPWRDRLLVAEVDDSNAAALGGVAAHAGLFGSVVAVGAFGRCVLADCLAGTAAPSRLVSREVMRLFLTRSHVPGSSRALGWDTMLPTSSCGSRMSPSAFGHTGFTGTSLWIDPARDLYAVLLTNRVYPDAGPDEAIRDLRQAFHDALIDGLGR